MGITEKTVKRHLEEAVRALADIIYGEPATVRKRP
jgi:predicted transcriptional regulator